MDDNATPKSRSYSRPVRYPASIPRTMTTDEQRAEIDAIAEAENLTLGEVVRELVELGIHDRQARGPLTGE